MLENMRTIRECDREHLSGTPIDKVVGEGLSEKVTLDPEPEWCKGAGHVTLWGNSVPGRWNSKCKGPEAGMCFERMRHRKEASVARDHRQGRGWHVTEAATSCTASGEFGFDSKDNGKPWKVLGSGMMRFNLNNPTGCWVEDRWWGAGQGTLSTAVVQAWDDGGLTQGGGYWDKTQIASGAILEVELTDRADGLIKFKDT